MFDKIDSFLKNISKVQQQSPGGALQQFLRNFAKFAGKHLCQSLFFNKVVGRRPATLLKKRLWHRCVPVNFVKLRRAPFLTEHLKWLLFKVIDCKKGRLHL